MNLLLLLKKSCWSLSCGQKPNKPKNYEGTGYSAKCQNNAPMSYGYCCRKLLAFKFQIIFHRYHTDLSFSMLYVIFNSNIIIHYVFGISSSAHSNGNICAFDRNDQRHGGRIIIYYDRVAMMTIRRIAQSNKNKQIMCGQQSFVRVASSFDLYVNAQQKKNKHSKQDMTSWHLCIFCNNTVNIYALFCI